MTLIAVLKTLIYGKKASAPLSEKGICLLAKKVRPINPALANFITEARFVDDLNDSLSTLEAANDFQECMYKAFAEFGAECKG